MDAMAVELREQAEVWSHLWSRRPEAADLLAPLSERGFRRVIFTGCGDCHAAAEYGEALLGLRSGLEARALPPMELSRSRSYLLDPTTLVIALSVSGRTPRVLEVLCAARLQGAATLAITDDPESPVSRAADAIFVLRASPPEALCRSDYRDPEAAEYLGYQRAVPQTKTYGAMQLALAILSLEVEGWCRSGRGTAPDRLEGFLAELPLFAGQAAQAGRRAACALLETTRPHARVTVCGTGLNGSTARFAGHASSRNLYPANRAVDPLSPAPHTVNRA